MKTESISQLILAKAQQFGPKMALCAYGDSAEEFTYRGLEQASGLLAARFVSIGLQPNDRVALLSESRPRWGVAFFATVRSGAVLVPLDFRQSAAEIESILQRVQPKILLVSRSQEHSVANYLRSAGSQVQVMSLEARDDARGYESIDAPEIPAPYPCVPRNSNDAALITFTSGTTGNSKGVVTTFGNLLFQIRSFRSVLQNDSHCTAVSILPLSHLFELTAGFLGLMYGGGRICFCDSLLPNDIATAMREEQVTCMVVVPLFLKLLANSIKKEIARLSPGRRYLFSAATLLAPLLSLKMKRKLFAKIHERFGGKLEYFVSGGAPLDVETNKFFDNIGMPVYQGYGMAETSPVIATNGPLANRPGSVGKALPGVEIRIADEDGGEILTRGPHVMSGYLDDATLTSKLIDKDGWLHTGDIGYVDADGFLFISGRKKNIIVLGDGKKVQPEEIEDLLFAHPLIQEGCIIGTEARRGIMKGTEEVCAVAVVSEEAVRTCTGNIEAEVRKLVEARARDLCPANDRPGLCLEWSRCRVPRRVRSAVRRCVKSSQWSLPNHELRFTVNTAAVQFHRYWLIAVAVLSQRR